MFEYPNNMNVKFHTWKSPILHYYNHVLIGGFIDTTRIILNIWYMVLVFKEVIFMILSM